MPSRVTILWYLLRELELKISKSQNIPNLKFLFLSDRCYFFFFVFFLFLGSCVTCNFDILIIFVYFVLLHTWLHFTYLVSRVMNCRDILLLKYEIVSNCASSSSIMVYSRVSYLIPLKQLLSNAEEILSTVTCNSLILNRTPTFLDSSISKIPAWQVEDSDSKFSSLCNFWTARLLMTYIFELP